MTGLGAIPFRPLAEIFPLLDGEALAALLPHIRCHSLFQVHGQHGTNCTFQKRSFLFEQQGVKRSHRMRAALALSGIFVSTVALAQNANTVTGSGVVIGRQGEILTNSHVTENCQSITVQISSGKMQPAILIARDEKNDLAVVLINPSSPAKVAAFRGGAPLRAGDSIVALGYPLSGLLATTTNLSVGIVSALAGLGDDVRYMQISAPVQPGNSGGPLLDTSGHLVGIVTAKLNAMRIARFTGDIPQNVNFALKAEVAQAFLENKGIVYRIVQSDQQLSPADIGDIARPFTAYIECQQASPQSAVLSAPPISAKDDAPQRGPEVAVVPSPRPATGDTPHPGQSFRDCADCPEMVVLPPGRFMMGTDASERGSASSERPKHAVIVGAAFAVEKYHVTRGEYARFVQASGYTGEKDGCAGNLDGTTKSWRDPGFPQSDRDPVVCVDWYDAKAYVKWLSRKTGKRYRLLTEAEWEYAARAGTTTARWWGDDIGRGHANCYDCGSQWEGRRRTSPVGSFTPNPFGLHDMLGNAYQWVEDCFGDQLGTYAESSNDASVARKSDECSNRGVRGGGWANNSSALRSSYRWSFYGAGGAGGPPRGTGGDLDRKNNRPSGGPRYPLRCASQGLRAGRYCGVHLLPLPTLLTFIPAHRPLLHLHKLVVLNVVVLRVSDTE